MSSTTQPHEKILTPILKSLNNATPNVRLVSARSLQEISRRFNSPELTEQVQKGIAALSEDPDKDVKQFVSDCSAS